MRTLLLAVLVAAAPRQTVYYPRNTRRSYTPETSTTAGCWPPKNHSCQHGGLRLVASVLCHMGGDQPS